MSNKKEKEKKDNAKDAKNSRKDGPAEKEKEKMLLCTLKPKGLKWR